MAKPAFTLVATATGITAGHISLPAGRSFILRFKSAGDFVLDVLEGNDPDFDALYYDATSKAMINSTIDGPMSVLVPGGVDYKMNVATYNSDITMEAYRAGAY